MRFKMFTKTAVLVFFLLVVLAVPVFAAQTHTVRSGESLYNISRKYGTTVAKIKADNNLKGTAIYPGQVLKISGTSSGNTYTVKKGDSLYKIAKNYGLTVASLKQFNGLKSDQVIIGQVLRIPSQVTSVSRSSGSTDDVYWLAKAVYAEARGESYQGQVAVAAVILNRLDAQGFPKTIKGVIFEPLAFTAVQDGQINLEPDTTAIKAAREALAGADPSGGALYYWNPQKSTSTWIWSRRIIKRIGNHVFGI